MNANTLRPASVSTIARNKEAGRHALFILGLFILAANGESSLHGDEPDQDGQESWRVFVGQWGIGAPDPPGGPPFVMTLNEDFSARKSHVPGATGKWEYAGGEARVTWSDGWRDILRREGKKYRKIAFRPGTTFDSPPDNTAFAVKKTTDQVTKTRLHVGWAWMVALPSRRSWSPAI